MSKMAKGLCQSVLSLSFNLAGMLAGTLLALNLDVFSATSWAILLFPGVLSIKGAIGGLFSGRLSTALHVGTIRASYTENTRSFYLLLYSIVTLTLGSSILTGLATSLLGVFLLGTTVVDSLAILAVMITTMGLALALISPITLGVSILSLKKGLDPDVIIYPVTSTVADILVTICYILVLNSFLSSQFGQILVVLFSLFFLLAVCYILNKNYREEEFAKTVNEFLLTLVFVTFIVNITGLTLNEITHIMGSNPKIYVVYPALIDTVGDVGSIVGSTATTKLALGTIRSSFSSIKYHLAEISGAWSASLVMFSLYAIIASFTYGSTASSEFWRFIVQLLITNTLAVSLIILVSFAVTISTHRRGWNPDNFVIPVESSMADSITTFSLLIALIVVA